MIKHSAQQSTFNQTGIAPVAIIVVVGAVLVLSYLAYQTLINKPLPSQSNTPLATSKPALNSPKPRSLTPGVITQVVTTKSIDLKTGAVTGPNAVFLSTEPIIYLVLTVKNPPVGTKIEYVRYLNDKFLDNRSTTTTKSSDNSVIFDWALKKPGAVHLKGNYKVKVYTNSVFEKDLTYTIQ